MWYLLYFTGQHGHRFQRLAVRLEALSTQVQRLSRERDDSHQLSLLLQGYSALTHHVRPTFWMKASHSVSLCVFLNSSFRQNQQGLAEFIEKELKRVSQQLDKLSRLHYRETHVLPPGDGLSLRSGEAQTLCLLKQQKTIVSG